jgi:cellulose synthase/poly-beta-1,6-N-acetylglucosamine synthase-like glycosyltransferase
LSVDTRPELDRVLEMLLVVDLGLLGLLAVYGLHRAQLVMVYLRKRAAAPRRRVAAWPPPLVTVQIPMYNEPRVAARILEEVAALDHPRECLQIQALDDSSDETPQIVAAKIEELQRRGFDAVHLRRPDRSGFKAGALAHGLTRAKGELILILDADYHPDRGLLRETLGYFEDPEVGMVQARHEHLNRDESWLTRVEATLLDGHFVIEQIARNRSGCFSTFHGTGGVWRKAAIIDAGGWDGDVLAEDTDISFRAQLRGWRFHYVTDPLAPSELPHDMPSFVAQQHRWVKGIAQTARKVLPSLLRSKQPWRVKLEGIFHLTGVFTYFPVAILALLQLPTVLTYAGPEVNAATALDAWLFAVSLTPMLVFYATARRATGGGAWETLLVLPALLAVGVGVSLANARAALEGLVGHRSEFVRTPKWGTGVLAPRAQLGGVVEVALGLYSLATLVVAVERGAWLGLAFHGLFAWGFLWVGAARLAPWRPSETRELDAAH